MQQLGTMIPPMNGTALSYKEFLEERVRAYNNLDGNLKYYDCDICKNKGFIAKLVDDYEVMTKCSCMKIRESLKRIESSGLTIHLLECSIESYLDNLDWQKHIKQKAMQYISDNSEKWFLICGQSGAGKTHICTAVLVKLIQSGKAGKYMLWREEATRLLAMINEQNYQDELNYLKNIEILYIDDLFKTKEDEKITAGEVKLAFDLINYRCIKNLKTIISTEFTVSELLKIDEALAGRIIQFSAEYKLSIKKDREKNYRLK